MEQRIILETDRLFLREMTMDDFDALYKVLADRDIMQHYPYSFDEKRVRDWIERNMNRYQENGFGLWAVCLKDTCEMIGDCGLTLQNIEGGCSLRLVITFALIISVRVMPRKRQLLLETGHLLTRITQHFIHIANIPMWVPIRRQNP